MIEPTSSLGLAPDGTPGSPLTVVDLAAYADRPVPDSGPGITVAVVEDEPTEALTPLLDPLTLSLGPTGVRHPAVVPVADPAAALADLTAAVEARPRAAVALAGLLRQTALLPATDGFAAEAAVYSMLLSGPEFTDWLGTRPTPSVPATADRELVRLDREGDHLRITLDHPSRHNALGPVVREQLYAALELAVIDDSITDVTLTGTGPSFSSGGDLAEFGTAEDLVAAYLVRVDRGPWRLLDRLRRRLGDRVVVRVNGPAIGAGAEIAAFGGRVLVTPGASFALPELAMGLVPGAGGTVSLVQRLGRHRAAWLMLTGARLDAAAAVAWGLADAIDPSGV